MKKIFLTGSTGFIGRNVKEFLQGRYLLFAPPREELDLLDKEAVRHYMEAHRVDTLIATPLTSKTRAVKTWTCFLTSSPSRIFSAA